MFVLTKAGERYVHITDNNLDLLYLASGKSKNICCSLRNEVRSLGIYSNVSNSDLILPMMFDVIHKNIKTDFLYVMPSTDEEMSKAIETWKAENNMDN